MMKLTKWDPFREFEDLFDRYSKAVAKPREQTSDVDWAPRVDIAETEKEFTIKAELPEVRKEDVKVNVEDGILTLMGERKQEKKEENKKYHRIERFYGNFTRSFSLPDNVDESKIEASFKDGVLKLQIPKTEAAKPKAIEVSVK